MGYVTIGIIALTAIGLFFGMLFGAMRGRNRAILRLVLVLICVVAAILLRGVVVDFVMDINMGDGTLKDELVAAFNDGDMNLPQSMQDLIITLVEIIIGLAAFFVLFIALRFVSWMIIFPICKIFVKKGAKKRKGAGALIGLLQGAVLAFVMCAPLTGIASTVNQISKAQMDGEALFEMPEEIDLDEYMNSIPGKVYGKGGKWFFDILSTGETPDGKKVSIGETTDIVVTLIGVADTATQLGDSMDIMSAETSTPEERIDAMKDVGAKLMSMGDDIDSLSNDAKEMVDDLLESVKDMMAEEGEEMDSAMQEAFENLTIDDLNLAAAGEAMVGIATYIEKTTPELSSGEAVTQEDVNHIVNGLAGSTFILDMMKEEEGLIDVEDEHKAMFQTAIANSTAADEYKTILANLLGL